MEEIKVTKKMWTEMLNEIVSLRKIIDKIVDALEIQSKAILREQKKLNLAFDQIEAIESEIELS